MAVVAVPLHDGVAQLPGAVAGKRCHSHGRRRDSVQGCPAQVVVRSAAVAVTLGFMNASPSLLLAEWTVLALISEAPRTGSPSAGDARSVRGRPDATLRQTRTQGETRYDLQCGRFTLSKRFTQRNTRARWARRAEAASSRCCAPAAGFVGRAT